MKKFIIRLLWRLNQDHLSFKWFGEKRPTIEEIVSNTMHKYSAQIAKNITHSNILLKELSKK